jgi:hypothetical protein
MFGIRVYLVHGINPYPEHTPLAESTVRISSATPGSRDSGRVRGFLIRRDIKQNDLKKGRNILLAGQRGLVVYGLGV